MKPFFLCCLVLLATACDLRNNGDREAMNVAAEWADAYFNADYHAAEALCTPDRPTLRLTTFFLKPTIRCVSLCSRCTTTSDPPYWDRLHDKRTKDCSG